MQDPDTLSSIFSSVKESILQRAPTYYYYTRQNDAKFLFVARHVTLFSSGCGLSFSSLMRKANNAGVDQDEVAITSWTQATDIQHTPSPR